jgi:general secretion pathway protein D
MYQNSNKIQAGLQYHLLVLLLLTMVTGCISDRPDNRLVKDPLDTDKYKVDDEGEYQASSEISTPIIDPIVKYGADSLFNRPTQRVYSAVQGEFSLDFVNIAIEDFVSLVFTEMLSKNYVLDSAIKGNVTVQTRGQINESQLLSIVESVLASKGAVLISRRNHFELVSLTKAKNYSLKPELYSARKIKPGYRMVVIPVNFVNPEDLRPILESVAPAAGHLKIDKERRAIVVTGSEVEISNVIDTVQIFDVSWLKAKSIALLPLENSEASVVKGEISKILLSQNKTHDIVLDTFDRFNALLVVAGHRSEIDAVKSWVKILDVEIPTADTQLYVYKVQNRKASELSDILNGIFNEEGEISITASSKGVDPLNAGSINPIGRGKKTVSADEVVMSNKQPGKSTSADSLANASLRFVADDTNNAIIILAKESEYRSIKAVIADLDTIPLQVLIEVSIIEVSLTDDLSFGVEWFLKKNGIADTYDAESTLDLNAGAGIGPVVPGFSFVLNGSETLVNAVFNTLASESKLNVVSTPSLMALDNHTATIRVGDQQPVVVSSAKSTDNEVLTQSIEYKSTGVLLSVTPRVNSGGLVTMELNQEVTDVGSIDIATGQRSFLQRNINSTVAVQDGRTIILGGLITENSSESKSGVPGLYKIPVFGWLFGKTADAAIKRELLVLITPKVIANHQIATKITQEYADKMQLLQSSALRRD